MPRGKKPKDSNAAIKGAKPTYSIAATLFAAADKLRGTMDAAEYIPAIWLSKLSRTLQKTPSGPPITRQIF